MLLKAFVFLLSISSQAAFRAPALPSPASVTQAFAGRAMEPVVPVPVRGQKYEYSCGPGALRSVLNYWGVYKGSERRLHSLLETTPKDGTEPKMLAIGARHFGLKAAARTNLKISDLRAALRRGKTVILDLQAWPKKGTKGKPWREQWDAGHYVVLVGMDRSHAYVMDPAKKGRYRHVPLPELVSRWHDFEDRRGPRQVYRRLGVVISGQTPAFSRLVPARILPLP